MGAPSVADLIKRGGLTKRGAQLVVDALSAGDQSTQAALEAATKGRFRGPWTGNEFKSAVAIGSIGLPTGFAGSGTAYRTIANHGGANAPLDPYLIRAGVDSGVSTGGGSDLSIVVPAGAAEVRFRADFHRYANPTFGAAGFYTGATQRISLPTINTWAAYAFSVTPGTLARWVTENAAGAYGTIDAGDIEWWGPASAYERNDVVIYGGRLYQVTGDQVTTTPGPGAVGWTDIGTVAAPRVAYNFDIAAGNATVNVGTRRLYNDTGRTLTLVGARATVGTAPTGASLIVDISKNGTTIFTNQANRPTIAAAAVTAKSGVPDVGLWGDGEYLTFDVDAIGTTVAGADLKVQVIAEG